MASSVGTEICCTSEFDHSIIHSTCPHSSLSTLIGSGNKIYGERNLIYTVYICKYIYCMCVYLYLNIVGVHASESLNSQLLWRKGSLWVGGMMFYQANFLDFFFFFFENVWQTPPFSGVPSQVWRGVKLGHEPSLFSELAVMEVLQDVSVSWKFFFFNTWNFGMWPKDSESTSKDWVLLGKEVTVVVHLNIKEYQRIFFSLSVRASLCSCLSLPELVFLLSLMSDL